MSNKEEKEINNKNEIIMFVGNDNGNNEHDIIIDGKLITQPNVHAKVRKLPNLDEVKEEYVLKNIEDNLIVTCEDPSGIYFIGNYALNSGERVRNIDVGIDNNKIESPIVLVNTIAQIAGQAVQQYLEKRDINTISDDEILNVKVDMATALPVSYYSTKNAEEFANKFLKKSHLVSVQVANKKVRCNIKFTYVDVIPEGVTTIFYLKDIDKDSSIFDEYNNEKDNENNIVHKEKLNSDFFKNAKVLHVAIGEGTTELPITKGIEFDPNFIRGLDNGIGHAIDKSLEEFKREKGLSKFSRQDYSLVLRDTSHKYHDLALEICEPYIEDEAEEILNNTKREIQRANNDIDIVVVYGGGSIFMKKYLYQELKRFCDRAEIKLLYIPAEYAVTIEAQGLYKFVNSKLFKMLKEQYSK